jgi:hypothetical protein
MRADDERHTLAIEGVSVNGEVNVDWDEMVPVVDWAASAVARKYGSFTTVDDLRQYGYEWVLAHPGRVANHRMTDGTPYRSPLVAGMIAHLTEVAKRERTRALGLQAGDQYTYTASMVERLLPDAWDSVHRPPAVEAHSSGKPDPAYGGDWEAMVMDVRRAVGKLPNLHLCVVTWNGPTVVANFGPGGVVR